MQVVVAGHCRGVTTNSTALVAMSTSVIDYFAVLGRGEGPLQCDPFTNLLSDEKNVITASEVLDEAITDIAVLTAGGTSCNDKLISGIKMCTYSAQIPTLRSICSRRHVVSFGYNRGRQPS